MDIPQAASAVALNAGGGAMVLGGVVAQASTNPDFSLVGVAGVIGGILTVAYPWYKITLEALGGARKLAEQARRIAELEQARAADKAESETALRLAKESADERVRIAEKYIDETRAMVDRLIPRVETAAKAIDTTTAAVQKVAESANVDVRTAPRMNGGHGAMDPQPDRGQS